MKGMGSPELYYEVNVYCVLPPRGHILNNVPLRIITRTKCCKNERHLTRYCKTEMLVLKENALCWKMG
jgi:hypothetical protein